MSRFLDYLDLEVSGRRTRDGGPSPFGKPARRRPGSGNDDARGRRGLGPEVPEDLRPTTLEPGRVESRDVRGRPPAARSGDSRASPTARTFEVRPRATACPIESLEAVREASDESLGLLTFQMSGSGALDDPDLTVSAASVRAGSSGRHVPPALSPRLEARLARGDLDGTVLGARPLDPDRRGPPFFGRPGRVDVELDASDVSAILLDAVRASRRGRRSARRAGAVRLARAEREAGSAARSSDRSALSTRTTAPGSCDGRPGEGALVGGPRDARELRAGRGHRPDAAGHARYGGRSPRAINGRISGEAQAAILELVRPGLGAGRAASPSTSPPAGRSRSRTSTARFGSRTGATGRSDTRSRTSRARSG